MKLSNSEAERLDKGAVVAFVSLILALGIKGKILEVMSAMSRLIDRQITNPGSLGWFDYFVVDVFLPLVMAAYIGVIVFALWWGVSPWWTLFVSWGQQRQFQSHAERRFDCLAEASLAPRSLGFKLAASLGMAFSLGFLIWLAVELERRVDQIMGLLVVVESQQPGLVSEDMKFFVSFIEPLPILILFLHIVGLLAKWFYKNVVVR